MKNLFLKSISACLAIGLIFFSCQKDISDTATPSAGPDFVSKVNASVSGFVIDQNNLPVTNAAVKVGGSTVFTDDYGFFEVRNVQVVKTAATVTVTMPGYF